MNSPYRFYVKIGKSILDYVFGVFIIIFFSWLFVFIVVLYTISFQYPFFYISKRTGHHGRDFDMVKFRTLTSDDRQALHQRRFWLGNFLRFTNLDELPQLWNVLKGEMSLVGPRPLPVEYLPLFSEEQKKRFRVKPGITGLAQVMGKNSLSWKKKFEYDLIYVEEISFRMDVAILFKTLVFLLAFKRDVSLREEPLK